MANAIHLSQLRLDVGDWNALRAERPEPMDFRGAVLCNRDLQGFNFRGCDFELADLSGAQLNSCDFALANLIATKLVGAKCQDARFPEVDAASANFEKANLYGSDFSNADCKHARLVGANCGEARFHRCNLFRADMEGADMEGADLTESDARASNFKRASLLGTKFIDTRIDEAYFEESVFGGTLFVRTDLSRAESLNAAFHRGPSSIDLRSLAYLRSVPGRFMRGCGLSEQLIEYLPSMLGEAIQFYSCFISYSSKDDAFARRLHSDLQSRGVRCWFAPEDLKIGDRIRSKIDESIKVHDKLLLVLSESSIGSAWVEKEVEAAFERERREENSTILFPISLDKEFLASNCSWAADIRRTRHVGDFSGWKHFDRYQSALDRLLRDLRGKGVQIVERASQFEDEDIPF